VLDDPAILESHLIKYSNLKRLTIRRAHESAGIRPAGGHAHPQLVPIRNHILDGQGEIWKRRAQKLDISLHAFYGWMKPKLVLNKAGIEMVLQYSVITFVKCFCNDLPERGLSTTTRFSHQRQLEMPILEGIQMYANLDNLLPPEPSRCAGEAAETSTVKGGSLGFPP